MTDEELRIKLKLIPQLIEHEGFRNHAYDDKTGKILRPGDVLRGNLTIGVGRNLNAKGLESDEIMMMLRNDINGYLRDCRARLPFFDNLDVARQAAVVDMVFNLGIVGFMGFSLAIKALASADYGQAASQMRQSAWYRQVGKRAETLAKMMETGEFPDLTSLPGKVEGERNET